ncbi:Dirigent protein 2 [Bienertia sinuspersici]
MLAKIIFCSLVSLSLLAVLLLALLSPIPYKNHDKPLVTLSLYIQQPISPSTMHRDTYMPRDTKSSLSNSGVLTYHRMLTEGPKSTSAIVGKAQGFIIPVEKFAHSAFNIIYLSFSSPEYSGSLSILAKELTHKTREELRVVGGTGHFAFARGIAVFAQANDNHHLSGVHNNNDHGQIYQVDLQLTFPKQMQSIHV